MWASVKNWWFKWVWRPRDLDRGYNEVEREALNNIRAMLKRKGWSKKAIEAHIVQVKSFVLLDHRQRKYLLKKIKAQKKSVLPE